MPTQKININNYQLCDAYFKVESASRWTVLKVFRSRECRKFDFFFLRLVLPFNVESHAVVEIEGFFVISAHIETQVRWVVLK